MKLLRRILLVLVILVAAGYAGVVGYMYFNQRALQYDADGPVVALADTTLGGAADIAVPSGDGVVHGWYQTPRAGKPLIVYYKGNSGSFSEEHERYEQFVADGYGFVAFDYRGFPASPGSISQQGILDDATAMFDWAAAKGFPVVIWGRSLGSGPATYVASVRDAEALLLETPFLSAVTVAGERYPFLPVGWVMQDQFPVNQWIVDVSEPVLVAHGTGDVTIDVSNGERLYDLVPNKDELWIEPGAGHSDLWDRGIWRHAAPFFERTMAASTRAYSTETPAYVTTTFPYKVTVTIAHNGQLYSGSKVWSIRAWAGTSPTSIRQARWSVVGEAIPIDVNGLGRIYFLKRTASNVSTDTFGGFVLDCERPPNEDAKFDIIKYVTTLPRFRSPCSVAQFAPIFVTAGTDAKSVEYLSIPWSDAADCVTTCLVSVAVEKTDEAVTTGIVSDLPWLMFNASPTAIIGEPERRSASVQSDFPPYYRQDFINERYERSP